MAIAILVIGAIILGFGLAGQVRLMSKRVQPANAGDRRNRNIVLRVAAIIIGAWLAIWGIVELLQSHTHTLVR